MAFKENRYRLLGFLSLLVAASALTAYAFTTGYYTLLILSAPCLVGGVWAIFRLFGQGVRKLTFMFDAIVNGDHSFHFTEQGNHVGDNLLNHALNRIRDILIAEKADIARMEEYYKLILDSVDTGVLVINDNGSIRQSTAEAHRLLRLSILTHVAQLARLDVALPAVFSSLRPGERRQVAFDTETGSVSLLLRTSQVKLRGQSVRIVALSEIGSELDEREVESWMNLTRVLTHEIMNSVTPITSLAETLCELPPGSDAKRRRGLQTIRDTSQGLLAFVDSYRRFTRIPEPVPVPFGIGPLLERLANLNSSSGVEIRVSVDAPDAVLVADEAQITQALGNLISNAIYAVREVARPRISLSSFVDKEGRRVIEVADNGPGIPEEIRRQIFVPFFTSKPDGSGIGLSIARRIMRLHGGSLTLVSGKNKTRFMMVFG